MAVPLALGRFTSCDMRENAEGVTFRVNLKYKIDIEDWIEEYCKFKKISLNIISTKKEPGKKFSFIRSYGCHHGSRKGRVPVGVKKTYTG